MKSTESGLFDIRTHEDFFRKAQADVDILRKDDSKPSAAMNAILSLYPLHYWVWACWLKDKHDVRRTLVIKNDKGFKKWLDGNCPHFLLLQDLANGAKHCYRTQSSTRRVAGYGTGPYGVGPYGSSYLLIDLGNSREPTERYLVVSKVLKETLKFWNSFFALYGIKNVHG
jgi:hypothetical protein